MRKPAVRYSIRFRIGNRLGAASKYSLKDFCTNIIDRYSITETEAYTIVTLQVKEAFNNKDLQITRIS